MSLRNSLRAATELQVAPPKACNAQLSEPRHATTGATGTQRRPANPGQHSFSRATGDATAMQMGRTAPCNSVGSVEKLQVAPPSACNKGPGALTAHRLLPDLVAAINACCDFRGDDDRNRAGLISEASNFTPHQQADLIEHFDEQAAICTRANRGTRP